MSCQPDQLFAIASGMAVECKNATDNEALRRAALSRLYYSAFHAGRIFHQSLPMPGSVGTARGKHEQLIQSLNSPTISKNNKKYFVSQAVAKHLRTALTLRVRADYHLEQNVTPIDVDECLAACAPVVNQMPSQAE
jgi:uncharacterized protein (UPF0332 family)